ncbi:MAG: VWA domain-containing protein [Deltaproteobacteria bacterium]|nr:VWA domain-containing protein [Deltaproteobacteria bacterium]
MNLSHPWILNFLWLLPLTAITFLVVYRKRRQALDRFAEEPLLKRLTPEYSRGRRILEAVLCLLALGCMLLALAGPRWGSHYQEVTQKGVDIVLALDVSPSMLVEDVKPDRLERAKREITDFLKVVQGDRVGLVAFSGAAYTQCPLTLDYGALMMFLNILHPNNIPRHGTDLGAAILGAMKAFDPKSETDKVILLITDGEDNEARGLEAARQAAAKGIKIFVFGMGDPSGGPIPASGGKGGFIKDDKGELVLSKLDEAGLQEIAAVTGGEYVRSMAGDLDLDLLYFDGIKQKTDAAVVKSGKIKVYEERFFIFAAAAFLLLLLEGLIGHLKRKTPVLFSILALFLFSAHGHCEEDPDELYEQGRFAEAAKIYGAQDMDNPRDIRYRYNRGCADYQASDFKGAMAAFSSVLKRTKDPETRVKALFNLGNAAFKQGDFASAKAYYQQTILLDPANENARFNLELSLRELEKQKKRKEEKQQQQNKQKKKGSGKEGKDGQKKRADDSSSNEKPSQDKEKPDQKKDQGQAKKDPGEGKQGKPTEPEAQKPKQVPAARIQKQKAEALLDNIKEDRARFLKYQVPEAENRGTSGKDW